MSTEYRNNDTYRGKPKYFGGGGKHFVLQKSHMDWPEGFVVDGVTLGQDCH